MKLYLGCGPKPFHKQHLEILGDYREWTLVDKFVRDSEIKNWDAEYLYEVEENTVDIIYSSHLLEHFPHIRVHDILKRWYGKMKDGALIMINVPDLVWASKYVLKYERGEKLTGYYTDFAGDKGVLGILYGTQSHMGEYHLGGFTQRYIQELFKEVGFKDVYVEEMFDAHDMGVLFLTATK